ncbi:MAG: DNA polymerase III subunit alpha [Paludibacteraceae bacterium]|nr:DNA polymerase III subunit alpha [Paludibacteraceae bacterium]
MMNFTHLHVHSHYSILDGMSKVPDLIDKCMRTGMRAMALTDHGNMYGIKEFLDYADKVNGAPKKKVKECKEELEKETDETKRAELEKKLQELQEKSDNFVPFKPIVGIEAYCAHKSRFKEQDHSRGWHLILLAKNKTGYHNLCKLSSYAFIEGLYRNPRIDHELLEKYHEGVICSSACLGGEVPQKIMNGDLKGAEESILWFKNLFGDDYYLELQRHKMDGVNYEQLASNAMGDDGNEENRSAESTYIKQQAVNAVLIELAQKHGIKIIATNDTHFVEKEHGEAHDRLICLSTVSDFDDPNRMHYTKQEWLKTPEEMELLFGDIPEALENTQEIVDKVEVFGINSDPIMPKFPIPEEFGTEEEYRKKITEQDLFDEFTRNEKGEVVLSQEDAEKKIKKLGGYDKLYRIKLEADYLAKLAWDGAKVRYGDNLTDEQRDRIIFELHIMKTMGFPGYFLIVQDYIRAAREELGVSVGPGRGSAAGSVVAYCLKITDIDPLEYDLLFERFLNPDRISLPDIDVDFDDDGRGKVLDWVTKKYGADHVAHIITYGTMASKSSIADVGRIQKVPLSLVNQIKGFVPERSFEESQVKAVEGKVPAKMPKVNLKNCYKYVPELNQMLNGHKPDGIDYKDATAENVSSMLTYAEELEDTNRQVGIHACGVIIGADDLTNFAPVCTVEDKETKTRVVVTQYDGHVVESVGLIKMDFLGLKTLSLIKEDISNINKTTGKEIDIDHIPIDDELTYQLYSEGRTIGTFQFESSGMQKYLRELKPTQITDLIAMNALYRPGPMDYIPQFIRRKQGQEPITYDIPVMEKYLKDTYGVTVYQEQVMLLSRLLADFTRGEADTLRKAMGKKIFAMLAILKPKFIEGGKKNGHDPKVLEKIWTDWEKFASYAFNKSHAACYAWVAYQTGYLKAHYPAEYMAANLTRNKDNITDVTKFMEECKAMKIPVKGPDINESDLNFTVNKSGEIRFGLGGIKGVGEGAVEAIVQEREKNGPYKSVFDFVERVNLSACNRKAIESIAVAGGFDCFGNVSREQLMAPNPKGGTYLETLVAYGNSFQNDQQSDQMSLFGELEDSVEISRPPIPNAPEWPVLERLNREKELVGIYISAHPLDPFKFEIKHLCKVCMEELKDGLAAFADRSEISMGGIVTEVREARTKKGDACGFFKVEDYTGSYEFALFGKDFVDFGKYMLKNAYIMLQCKVIDRNQEWARFQKKKDDEKKAPDYRLKIQRIELLSEAKDKLVKKLTLQIDFEEMTKELCDELLSRMRQSEGKIPLYFEIKKGNRKMKFFSRNVQVELSSSLLDYLLQKEQENVLTFSVD